MSAPCTVTVCAPPSSGGNIFSDTDNKGLLPCRGGGRAGRRTMQHTVHPGLPFIAHRPGSPALSFNLTAQGGARVEESRQRIVHS